MENNQVTGLTELPKPRHRTRYLVTPTEVVAGLLARGRSVIIAPTDIFPADIACGDRIGVLEDWAVKTAEDGQTYTAYRAHSPSVTERFSPGEDMPIEFSRVYFIPHDIRSLEHPTPALAVADGVFKRSPGKWAWSRLGVRPGEWDTPEAAWKAQMWSCWGITTFERCLVVKISTVTGNVMSRY